MFGKKIRLLSRLSVFALAACLAGCATGKPDIAPPRHTLAEVAPEEFRSPFDINDPIEPFNRGVYRFNYYFDTYFLSPIVRVYEAVTPDYVENRISDFVANIFEINNLTNCTLQLQPRCLGTTVGRVLVNSTVGIGGLWDPATRLGLERESRDFGQTLGYYGVGNGPYLVLPFLGPSNVRDAIGFAADSATVDAAFYLTFDEALGPSVAFNSVSTIDRRHRTKAGYFESGSPFEYELIRMLYTKSRTADIERLQTKPDP